MALLAKLQITCERSQRAVLDPVLLTLRESFLVPTHPVRRSSSSPNLAASLHMVLDRDMAARAERGLVLVHEGASGRLMR